MPRTEVLIHKYAGSWKTRKQSQLPRLNLNHENKGVIAQLPHKQILAIYQRARRQREQGTHEQQWLPFERLQKGPRHLHGQFAAIKDNFVTDTLPTGCASKILQGFAAPDANVVTLLEKAGMKILAKTNMDEFGMGSHTTHSVYGKASNKGYSAGGSSGGSAIAVANNLVDCALGSDTGGSVRLPAAYTNVIGFKPSYGRISRAGLIPYANSLDTVGILAQKVETIANVFEMIDTPDQDDPTCLSRESRTTIQKALRQRTIEKAKTDAYEKGESKFKTLLVKRVKKCRIGVPEEYNIAELHPLVRKAWMLALENLHAAGHDIIPISLPSTKQALSAYYVLAPAEASSNLAKYDGVRYGAVRDSESPDDVGGTLYAQHRGTLFGDEVKRRILLGAFSLSAGAMDNYFIQAQKVRRMVQRDFNLVFRLPHPLRPHSESSENGVDFIVCPTAPTLPPKIESLERADPVETYMNDVFTVPASLAGLPAISMPARYDFRTPETPDRAIGIQIIGQYGDDIQLLNFARREFEEKMEYAMPSNNRRHKMH